LRNVDTSARESLLDPQDTTGGQGFESPWIHRK
jgi:hypothetical protein